MRFAIYHNLFVFVNMSFPYIIALVSFLIIEQFQQSFLRAENQITKSLQAPITKTTI